MDFVVKVGRSVLESAITTANGIVAQCVCVCRSLGWFAALTAAGGMLASCGTPVGVSPALQGTYWQHALVTNPDGAGPQVVRWGPPQNDIPRADQ